MTIFLVTLLLLVCAAVLAYPFLRPSGRVAGVGDPAEEIAAQLRRARDRVYEEIRALQQEYFLRNITEEEYQAQLQAARLRAADLIRRQRQVQETLEAVEAQIDAELAEFSLAADADDDEEQAGQAELQGTPRQGQ